MAILKAGEITRQGWYDTLLELRKSLGQGTDRSEAYKKLLQPYGEDSDVYKMAQAIEDGSQENFYNIVTIERLNDDKNDLETSIAELVGLLVKAGGTTSTEKILTIVENLQQLLKDLPNTISAEPEKYWKKSGEINKHDPYKNTLSWDGSNFYIDKDFDFDFSTFTDGGTYSKEDIQKLIDEYAQKVTQKQNGTLKTDDEAKLTDLEKQLDSVLSKYWNESVAKAFAILQGNIDTFKTDPGKTIGLEWKNFTHEWNAAYGFENDPYVKPDPNIIGEFYLENRHDEILEVLQDSKNLDYTITPTSDKITNTIKKYIVCLLMPQYERRVEVEDLDRNFWVIGQTLTYLLLLTDPENAPWLQPLKDALKEIAGLWENVFKLWQTVKGLEDKVNNYSFLNQVLSELGMDNTGPTTNVQTEVNINYSKIGCFEPINLASIGTHNGNARFLMPIGANGQPNTSLETHFENGFPSVNQSYTTTQDGKQIRYFRPYVNITEKDSYFFNLKPLIHSEPVIDPETRDIKCYLNCLIINEMLNLQDYGIAINNGKGNRAIGFHSHYCLPISEINGSYNIPDSIITQKDISDSGTAMDSKYVINNSGIYAADLDAIDKQRVLVNGYFNYNELIDGPTVILATYAEILNSGNGRANKDAVITSLKDKILQAFYDSIVNMNRGDLPNQDTYSKKAIPISEDMDVNGDGIIAADDAQSLISMYSIDTPEHKKTYSPDYKNNTHYNTTNISINRGGSTVPIGYICQGVAQQNFSLLSVSQNPFVTYTFSSVNPFTFALDYYRRFLWNVTLLNGTGIDSIANDSSNDMNWYKQQMLKRWDLLPDNNAEHNKDLKNSDIPDQNVIDATWFIYKVIALGENSTRYPYLTEFCKLWHCRSNDNTVGENGKSKKTLKDLQDALKSSTTEKIMNDFYSLVNDCIQYLEKTVGDTYKDSFTQELQSYVDAFRNDQAGLADSHYVSPKQRENAVIYVTTGEDKYITDEKGAIHYNYACDRYPTYFPGISSDNKNFKFNFTDNEITPANCANSALSGIRYGGTYSSEKYSIDVADENGNPIAERIEITPIYLVTLANEWWEDNVRIDGTIRNYDIRCLLEGFNNILPAYDKEGKKKKDAILAGPYEYHIYPNQTYPEAGAYSNYNWDIVSLRARGNRKKPTDGDNPFNDGHSETDVANFDKYKRENKNRFDHACWLNRDFFAGRLFLAPEFSEIKNIDIHFVNEEKRNVPILGHIWSGTFNNKHIWNESVLDNYNIICRSHGINVIYRIDADYNPTKRDKQPDDYSQLKYSDAVRLGLPYPNAYNLYNTGAYNNYEKHVKEMRNKDNWCYIPNGEKTIMLSNEEIKKINSNNVTVSSAKQTDIVYIDYYYGVSGYTNEGYTITLIYSWVGDAQNGELVWYGTNGRTPLCCNTKNTAKTNNNITAEPAYFRDYYRINSSDMVNGANSNDDYGKGYTRLDNENLCNLHPQIILKYLKGCDDAIECEVISTKEQYEKTDDGVKTVTLREIIDNSEKSRIIGISMYTNVTLPADCNEGRIPSGYWGTMHQIRPSSMALAGKDGNYGSSSFQNKNYTSAGSYDSNSSSLSWYHLDNNGIYVKDDNNSQQSYKDLIKNYLYYHCDDFLYETGINISCDEKAAQPYTCSNDLVFFFYCLKTDMMWQGSPKNDNQVVYWTTNGTDVDVNNPRIEGISNNRVSQINSIYIAYLSSINNVLSIRKDGDNITGVDILEYQLGNNAVPYAFGNNFKEPRFRMVWTPSKILDTATDLSKEKDNNNINSITNKYQTYTDITYSNKTGDWQEQGRTKEQKVENSENDDISVVFGVYDVNLASNHYAYKLSVTRNNEQRNLSITPFTKQVSPPSQQQQEEPDNSKFYDSWSYYKNGQRTQGK